MPTEVKMPQLGESVVEGTIGKWLKQPGDRVEQYEALLEVTTDKVDTEVPAPATGVLREIVVPEGQTVRVGTLLALLEADGDGAEPAASGQQPAASGQQPAASKHATGDGGADVAAGGVVPAADRSGAATFVSPVVARLAAEHDLDLGRIRGTGQGGRVTKQDVLKYLEAGDRGQEAEARSTSQEAVKDEPDARQPAAAAAPAAPPAWTPPVAAPPGESVQPVESILPDDAEIVPLTAMRRSIAEHMARSVRTSPHVTTVVEVDVGRIAEHRKRSKEAFERQGVKLTFTPYFLQATVAGLQAVPHLNGSFTDEGLVVHRRIHVGVAVALDEGLIVPVVRDADEKNLLGLARAVNDLSERARSRRLRPEETQGGTFTITNHGVSGSLFATPIINQPQGGILGVGAIQKRAVVVSGGGVDAIAIRPMCYLSLTFDHRLLDGAEADGFLAAVKRFLEGYGGT